MEANLGEILPFVGKDTLLHHTMSNPNLSHIFLNDIEFYRKLNFSCATVYLISCNFISWNALTWLWQKFLCGRMGPILNERNA